MNLHKTTIRKTVAQIRLHLTTVIILTTPYIYAGRPKRQVNRQMNSESSKVVLLAKAVFRSCNVGVNRTVSSSDIFSSAHRQYLINMMKVTDYYPRF